MVDNIQNRSFNLIVAPGYTDEIAASIRQKFGDRVRIMTMRTDHVEVIKDKEL